MKRVGPALIGLLGARVGAAVLDRSNQLINKLIDQSALLIREIVFFCRVIIQIVELHQGQILVLQRLGRAWVTPAAGARAEDEFPRAASDGKGTINGVMNGKGA